MKKVKKLQIGVKKRGENCDKKSSGNIFVTMMCNSGSTYFTSSGIFVVLKII